MKTILTAAALAALVFSSAALAQQGSFGPRGEVYCGTVIGQDPDPIVRKQLVEACAHQTEAG